MRPLKKKAAVKIIGYGPPRDEAQVFLSRPRNFGGFNEKSSLSRRHCDWPGTKSLGNDCGGFGRAANSGSNKGSGSDETVAGSERHQQGQVTAARPANLQQQDALDRRRPDHDREAQ